MNYTAEIISVGTELLLGNVTNTDAKDISYMLSELGINVYFHTVVGDNSERLKNAVEIARKRADIIITTGGLGPTCDDLTKQTLAEAFEKELIYNKDEGEKIKRYFETKLRTYEMTENNLLQALLPENCTVFHNEWGTAPGCAFDTDGVHVLMLPGPPRECVSMFKNCAVPYLKKLADSEICSHNIHVIGMTESAVEDRLHDIMTSLKNPTLAPYAKEGEVLLRVTAKAASKDTADILMNPVIENVQKILGDVIYGIDKESFESVVLELLRKNNKTLSTAESCTGGFISKRLTDVPGASENYIGGAVTYSNKSKHVLLNVDERLIEDKGAVSAEVAEEMAKGIRKKLGTDIGLSVTGVAGPGSDEKGTEVGTVYIALADETAVYCRKFHLGAERVRVRTSAAMNALDMVRRYLSGLDIIR